MISHKKNILALLLLATTPFSSVFSVTPETKKIVKWVAIVSDSIEPNTQTNPSVTMGEGKSIERNQEETANVDKFIYAFYPHEENGADLDGIYLGCYVLYKNGTQRAFLTLYNELFSHLKKLKDLCSDFTANTNQNPIEQAVIIAMSPQSDSKLKKATNKLLIKKATAWLSHGLSNKKIKIIQETYRTRRDDLTIQLSSNPKDSYYYRSAGERVYFS